MKRMIVVTAVVMMVTSCNAHKWPDRAGRAPAEMLTDVVRWQQLAQVKQSTGELHFEAFTWIDLHRFHRNAEHDRIAATLTRSPDFQEITQALRGLPPEQLRIALDSAASLARPTWRSMGYIDRSGHGQTEAGHIADLMVADAVVREFAAALSASPPRPKEDWKLPGPKSWPAR